MRGKKLTDKEVLKKAIEKAVENGWNAYSVYDQNEKRMKVYIPEGLDNYSDWLAIIFSHDFAKALWGEGEVDQKLSDTAYIMKSLSWQHHLQQMVLEENPIDYLRQFIDDE